MCETSHDEITDADLILRLQGGEMAAFDLLFQRHRVAVLNYVLGLLGERGLAEDVVQEAFLAFVRRIERIDPRLGARAWLLRVARNRAIDMMRKRRPEILTDEPPERGIRPEEPVAMGLVDEVAAREEHARVLAAVRNLPAAERDVLLLHYISDLPFREVAATLKRPLGTVLWQSRRGIERLRKRGFAAGRGSP